MPFPPIRRALVVQLAVFVLSTFGFTTVQAAGVSPYLPLQRVPELESQIERVMILAGEPVLTRPIPLSRVMAALPAACERDAALCDSVNRYLRAFRKKAGLDLFSVGIAATGGRAVTLPNRRGMAADSAFEVSASGFWQPGEHLLVSAGLIGYNGETTATGSMLSFGIERFQVDIGYREHWLSPQTSSSMLIGAHAPTMPSITVSNPTALTRWRFRYEVFLAEMSHSARIRFGNQFTSGRPRLAGVHFSFEPFPGFAIGVNRIMQYGGGQRSDSLGDLFDAFLRPSEYDNTADRLNANTEFGNQAASITARYMHDGERAFAVYVEYAGEDTSTNSNLRLGNTALSVGLDLPSAFRNVDLTFEVSEWQNAWYEHSIYQDGLRNDGYIIGHWGGDQRLAGDAVGARAYSIRAGWRPSIGGQFEASWRSLRNESYSAVDYESARFARLRYSRDLGRFSLGGLAEIGRGVFGNAYSRLGAFVRF